LVDPFLAGARELAQPLRMRYRARPMVAPRERAVTPMMIDRSIAGVVLGPQSVPDGLATELLAGVNPLAGLNAPGDERVGATVKRAHADAVNWVSGHP